MEEGNLEEKGICNSRKKLGYWGEERLLDCSSFFFRLGIFFKDGNTEHIAHHRLLKFIPLGIHSFVHVFFTQLPSPEVS